MAACHLMWPATRRHRGLFVVTSATEAKPQSTRLWSLMAVAIFFAWSKGWIPKSMSGVICTARRAKAPCQKSWNHRAEQATGRKLLRSALVEVESPCPSAQSKTKRNGPNPRKILAWLGSGSLLWCQKPQARPRASSTDRTSC